MPVPMGLLLPETFLHSSAFAFLAAFVTLNTLMYVALAVAKMLPRIYLGDYLGRRGRRRETRSIDPDAPLQR